MSNDARLERITTRTYRIRHGRPGATTPASQFEKKGPDAAQDYPPSRFAGWVKGEPLREQPSPGRRPD